MMTLLSDIDYFHDQDQINDLVHVDKHQLYKIKIQL